MDQLSRGLTRERALAGARYMDEERLLGAYLLFYWPISYLHARGVLSELPGRARAVLDLGSGPAPMAFAALDAGAAEVTAADRSGPALEAARALASAAGEPLATRRWDPARGDPVAAVAQGKRFDAVILGHVVNELFGHDLARRTKLLEDCAALLRETDWCHAERPIEPPPLVAEIARAAGLRKEAVKMSYLVVAPRGEEWAPPPAGRVFRIVSEPLPSKGRLRYMGCGPEGRMGLALQEKHVGEGNRAFEGLLRGDVVEVEGTEASGEGVKLGPGSTVRVVARAGERVRPGEPGAVRGQD